MHHRLCFAVLATFGGFMPVAVASERTPNVVFFLVDDLGWTDVGCYGSTFYETPHLDEFAESSVRFTQAYAACHVCSPTRASIMTGKYPARLQLTDWLPGRKDFSFQVLTNAVTCQQLPLAESTLAETLKENGFATGHFGKWHLGEDPYGPRQQGFDVQIPHWNKGWPKSGYHAPFDMDGLTSASGDYLTDRLTDEALGFMEAHQTHPFFLYLSHFAVHDPIQGRAELVEKYRSKLSRAAPSQGPAFTLEGNPDDATDLSSAERDALAGSGEQGYRLLPDRMVNVKQRQDNVHFAAMVESMDASFGRVLTKLQALGLEDDTIVVFFSDNGGMSAANFGNPARVIPASKRDTAFSTSNLPLRGGKGWLYEGGIRVPLMIKWPKHGRQGITCDVPVISTDFYPSILEMVGIARRPDQHRDGVSLKVLLQGGQELPRQALYWHFPHYSNHGLQSPGGAVRAGDYKLLEYFESQTVQLFNLQTDPGEKHDLSREDPETTARLRSMLHAWREDLAAYMPSPNPEFVPSDRDK